MKGMMKNEYIFVLTLKKLIKLFTFTSNFSRIIFNFLLLEAEWSKIS